MIDRRAFLTMVGAAVVAAPIDGDAQSPYRVGVISHGGSYDQAIAGLREGLKDLGWEHGAQYLLHMRDGHGDLKAVVTAATSLEAEKVDLICAFSTSTALTVKQATKRVPIVFHAGTDPVKVGLVESFRRPGGRLTGVYSQATDLTAKRLEVLKEMVPGVRRVLAFYNPDNPAALESIKEAREGARRLKIVLVERRVASVDELRSGLRSIRAGEVDGLVHIADVLATSHADMIIDFATAKKLPLILQDKESASRGALASYGLSYYTGGHLTAKYVQRVLLGANPAEMPIEQIDRLQLVFNLRTAKALGLTIPQSLLVRADELIQ
jgi:putative tryptophan/tyrosine transport system substrate-binding protein